MHARLQGGMASVRRTRARVHDYSHPARGLVIEHLLVPAPSPLHPPLRGLVIERLLHGGGAWGLQTICVWSIWSHCQPAARGGRSCPRQRARPRPHQVRRGRTSAADDEHLESGAVPRVPRVNCDLSAPSMKSAHAVRMHKIAKSV